jgi:hypothetical protein
MAYLLDTDVFIQAKNLHYGFDFCPAFWDWILARHQEGSVFSIEKVKDELVVGDDELAEWAKSREPSFFSSPDASVLPALATTTNWAVGEERYEQVAVNGFLQHTDYYLVATTLAKGHVVVSHEVPSNSPKKIKIPDACISLGIKFVNPFEMLRRERANFILGPDRRKTA